MEVAVPGLQILCVVGKEFEHKYKTSYPMPNAAYIACHMPPWSFTKMATHPIKAQSPRYSTPTIPGSSSSTCLCRRMLSGLRIWAGSTLAPCWYGVSFQSTFKWNQCLHFECFVPIDLVYHNGCSIFNIQDHVSYLDLYISLCNFQLDLPVKIGQVYR